LGNGTVEVVFLGVIGMGEHGSDFDTAGEQGFNPGTTNIDRRRQQLLNSW
jgi:hypothetical protein